MAAQNSNSAASLSQRLRKLISGSSHDYSYWRSLILEIETTTPEDIDTLSLAYDSFLSMFPLCHWHLEKYAYQKGKLCNSEEALNIYERGAEVAMFSVGFWVNYFTFAAACFGDPKDVRRLFGRAISFVGKNYFCHVLWDKYLRFEFNQEGWSFLAQSYIQVLRFPTKKLHFYFDNFKQFVANLEEEMEYDKNNSTEEHASVNFTAIDLSKDEISLVIKDMLDSSDISLKCKALDKYRSTGEEIYHKACQMEEKIKRFETKIQRQYFDVTPLDDDQLNNWHLYLDFVEKEDNLDSAMKLYERCLIPCANYPEFWMRYVEFLESKGGRELAISSLARATKIFLKNVPEIHLFDARFKEHIGDIDGAHAALVACDTKTDSSFIENVAIQANLERRLGDFVAASATYEKALKRAREKQKLHLLPCLYSHMAKFTFLMTGNAVAARDILIEGIQEAPRCRFLIEELVKFAMTHEGARHVTIIDSVIVNAISPGLDEYEGLNAKDRENISRLFLEFVDHCGTTHDIRKAWNRHFKLFPQSLRIRTPYKHFAPGNYSMDLAVDKKGNNDIPLHSQPLRQKDHVNNAKETAEVPFTKVVSSNDDESHGNEMACEISGQSREDRPSPMVVSAELTDQATENALSVCNLDQDELRPMNVGDELGLQSKENALSPHESPLEIRKSTETTKPIEAPCSSLVSVQHPISMDNVSLNSQEKESERDGPSRTGEDSIGTDHTVPSPRRAASRFEDDHKHKLEQSSYSHHQPIVTNQITTQPSSEKATDQDQPTSTMTPSNMSAGPGPVSYPQQNTDQTRPMSDQDSFQTQENMSMNQMLHYHYQQQQQLLQQQYQQQLQMQNSYYQHYMDHQQYQYQQQHYQSSIYQPVPSFEQSQQQSQPVQGQEPRPNFQQAQYQQSPDPAYQAYQLAYQQYTSKEQQLLWQQYQQYQGHQHPQHRSMSQNQKGPKTDTPDYDGASKPSESPHLRIQSPLADGS